MGCRERRGTQSLRLQNPTTDDPPPPPPPRARGRWPWPCSRTRGRCWRSSRERGRASTQALARRRADSDSRSQLQDLTECTGITIEFDRRLVLLPTSPPRFEAPPTV